jgi:hypothetical protein
MRTYIIQNIRLPIEASKDEVFACANQRLLKFFSKTAIGKMKIHKSSVDARKKTDIQFVYSVAAEIEDGADDETLAANGIVPTADEKMEIRFGDKPLSDRPIVVGFGPCGMFCALILAENGYRPIVIERGSAVEKRAADVERFFRLGILDPESNIQFGAGGAGTFSDGKLVTRIHDPKCGFVLSEMHRLGAPEEILYQSKPHIGTDYLKTVVSAMERKIISYGGEVLFDTKLEALRFSGDRVSGIETNKGALACGALILALGHSARDTFDMLSESGIGMVSKAFSVGVRIEHLQSDIDEALYGKLAGDPRLPRGEYNLSCHNEGRGVYTFCMCPGGEVVAAASEAGGVVTNGMSNFLRDGKNANSAVAVSVNPSDCGGTVKAAVAFQRSLEALAYRAGGESYAAPCETVGDFLGRTHGREPSRVLPTYRNGNVQITALDRVFPGFISDSLRFGLTSFDRKIHGFAADHAVLTGVETRTSSPLRIPRGEAMTAFGFDNLYPCGEGSGYAGGITSAAVDGINCALAVMEKYQKI